MSQNKKALVRYLRLDKCLKNHQKRYFIENLLEEVNIELREQGFEEIKRTQLYKDLVFMETSAYQAPIERLQEGKKKYIRYADPNFSIQHSALSERDANQLREALLILNRFSGMPQFRWVQEIIPKVEQSFKLKSEAKEIIGFESNIYLKGLQFLGPLFDAILYEKVITLSYQSFRSDVPKVYEIHPYYIKQYNNRWFLFGYNPDHGDLTTFSFDRMIDIKENSRAYIENDNYDFTEYFEDIIGITLNKEETIQKIVLKFSKQQTPYVLTKPIHGSQKIISHLDDELIVSIEVIPNFELEVVLLGFGEHVQILEPASIISKLAERIDRMSKLY
jgi:predicted DNA-binding transcriptional regulator YafY